MLVEHLDDDLFDDLLATVLHDDHKRRVKPLLEDPNVSIVLEQHTRECCLQKLAPDGLLLLEEVLDRRHHALGLGCLIGAQVLVAELVEVIQR